MATATTVHEAFALSARQAPDAPFLFIEPVTARTYGIPAGTITYGEAAESVETLKKRFQAAGLGPGHRVGLLLANRPSFFHHWFALNALGVSVVPISPEMRRAEWAYLIGHSGMCMAVCLADRVQDLTEAAGDARREYADAAPRFAAVVEGLDGGLPQVPSVAAAGGADQRDDLPGAHAQGDIGEGLDRAARRLVRHADLLQVDQ